MYKTYKTNIFGTSDKYIVNVPCILFKIRYIVFEIENTIDIESINLYDIYCKLIKIISGISLSSYEKMRTKNKYFQKIFFRNFCNQNVMYLNIKTNKKDVEYINCYIIYA